MSILAGFALRKLREETDRRISDRGIFRSSQAPAVPSTHGAQKAYDRFLETEDAVYRQRRRRRDLQTSLLVVLGILLPVLLVALTWLFFY